MSPSELRSKLQGVIGFPVTPFNADLSLDLDGYRRNLRAMLAHPPAAIVAAGGTGELYSLSPAEHLAVVRAAVEEVQGAVPVIAGAGFNGPIAARPRAAGGGRRGEWHPGLPALLSGRRRRRVAAVLPGHRERDRAGVAHLQPRLVSSFGAARRASRRHPHAHRLEGRPGRYPAPADSPVAGREPPALDRRRRRRSGAGVLRDRHPRVHVERRQRRARRSRASCTTPPRAATPPPSRR